MVDSSGVMKHHHFNSGNDWEKDGQRQGRHEICISEEIKKELIQILMFGHVWREKSWINEFQITKVRLTS